MTPTYLLVAEIFWYPLIGMLIIMIWLAHKDSYWLGPAMYVTLVSVVDAVIQDRPIASMAGVFLFLNLLARAIIRWDLDEPNQQAYIPKWSGNRPSDLAQLEAMQGSRPKGYHRPNVVESRTSNMKQIGS